MSNRLQHEKSPYLLQHKDNPVDWYPWGEGAFERARQEDKPIFLSIGYATCHWCHVMEHESFEDPEVAALLNDTFVSIKVDREERPDIDQIYMSVCQLVTGQGGWPLTILMTPDARPFFAATYIPKRTRHNRLGMIELIPRIQTAWKDNREEVLEAAGNLTGALQRIGEQEAAGEEPTAEWLRRAYEQLAQRFDPAHGGFGRAPKFPSPGNLLLLLRYWARSGDEEALRMVQQTLDPMRRGGIYDHVGFGFHRYATDRSWTLPHFEKMLYDQAMLVLAYTEAYQATGVERYRTTVQEVLSYVLRDMTDPKGGFYSAEDADSEGREGAFYVWSIAELQDALGPKDALLVSELFNLEHDGNFEDEATGKRTGENVLFLRTSFAEAAAERGLSEERLAEQWEQIRQRLFALRKERVHPLKDDKILTDWNGLMIAAFARAARVLNDDRYAEAARHAVDFLLQHLQREDGRLWHRYRQGAVGLQANLEDYAFLCWGLLELYETTFTVRYLHDAARLAAVMIEHFEDDERGGFFFTPDDGEDLIVRPKEAFDQATPSGNSVAVLVLIRLSRLLARPEWEDKALQAARAYGDTIRQHPSAFSALLQALDHVLGESYEVVIAGDPAASDTQAMLRRLRSSYVPNKVVLLRPEGDEAQELVQLAPYLEHQRSRDGRATAYVCQNHQCNQPTTDPDVMLAQLSTGT